MSKVILGRKGRMSQMFTEEGVCIPVTFLEAGPCFITKVLETAKDGYSAVQVGYDEVREKVLSKAEVGHCKAAGVAPQRVLKELRLADTSKVAVGPAKEGEDAVEVAPGAPITVGVFEIGDVVDISGESRGRGWAGVMRRHGFGGGRMTHGGMARRRPGSIGAATYPGRVIKGKRMGGRMGGERITVKNVEIVGVDTERNILIVKGSVPGHRGTLLFIRTALTAGV
ncbi:MAG: 50S ribosomal protein L3 [Planctomycetota bacterium]